MVVEDLLPTTKTVTDDITFVTGVDFITLSTLQTERRFSSTWSAHAGVNNE